MSKCRQMNKLYFGIIKSRGRYGIKTKYFELKSQIQKKFCSEKVFVPKFLVLLFFTIEN